MFFEGFGTPEVVKVEGVGPFRLRRAGHGPAVVLLHGHPQTHAAWHAVAPSLVAHGFSVICPDLPGYGGSLPEAREDAERGTKAAMSRTLHALLDALGVGSIRLGGHDRGGRVAEQMAIDRPDRVARLALIDVIPVLEPVERVDMAFSLATYRMFWFAQKHPKPESLFRNAPDTWRQGALPGGEDPATASLFHPEAIADYVAAGLDPEALERVNAAYHAASERDAVADRIARVEQRRLTCPTLVLWGARGVLGGWYDPVRLWAEHGSGPFEGQALEAGHFTIEEQPGAVAERMAGFFAPTLSSSRT